MDGHYYYCDRQRVTDRDYPVGILDTVVRILYNITASPRFHFLCPSERIERVIRPGLYRTSAIIFYIQFIIVHVRRTCVRLYTREDYVRVGVYHAQYTKKKIYTIFVHFRVRIDTRTAKSRVNAVSP